MIECRGRRRRERAIAEAVVRERPGMDLLREYEQAAAVERLVRLLEAQTPGARRPRAGQPDRRHDRLHQMARLREARAAYVLATGGGMERVGPGAWIRRRRSR
ncbi:MAG TPA: hypothetical protein VKT32_14780 [Chthonomonadaceae bacterium]|nr:hypothetical protein [Chthonomonadaceae bacterium]